MAHSRAHEAGFEGDALPVWDAGLGVEHMQDVGLQRAIDQPEESMGRREIAGGNDPWIRRKLREDARELLEGDLLHANSVTLEGEILVQHSLLE